MDREKNIISLHLEDSRNNVDAPIAKLETTGSIRPQMRRLHDPNVTFEEYNYYAQQAREEEATLEDVEEEIKPWRAFLYRVIPNLKPEAPRESETPVELNLSDLTLRATITDQEWTNASRAVRTASTGATFYLITTDVMGPFAVPPAIALFTVLGAFAAYAGFLLWRSFMGLDSHQFPLRNYGDIGYRLYGRWLRYLFNFLQTVQLVCSVAAIIISNGQSLSEASKYRLCYYSCCLVWACVGFVLSQVRTLRQFSWLANATIFINVTIIIVTMAAAGTGGPNHTTYTDSAGYSVNPDFVSPSSNGTWPKVFTSAGLPDPADFNASLVGLMQAVFAFGGAQVFVEFMSELRRPRDFLKSMWAAQLFIYICYLIYASVLYHFQGQYAVNPSYLGVSHYTLQTAANSLAMCAALIAALMYGNIGAKVIYNNILVEWFKAPPLNHRKGKYIWVALSPVYWGIAYIIGASIPAFADFTAIISAACILQFCHTFPPLLCIAYNVKKYSALPGEGFDPITGETTRHDGGLKRFMRGFFGRYWYMNVFNLFYFLAALSVAGLGLWSACVGLIKVYKEPQEGAFVCHSPVE